MKKIWRNVTFGFLALGVFCVLYASYQITHSAEFERNNQLAAILYVPEEPLHLEEQVKFTDCEARGPLPDPDCTPGSVFADATREEICVSGYSKTVRNVSKSLKKKVFEEYGIQYPVPFGSYEIDHLIPLSLGGSNDISNLWPKSAEPFPGFYEKNITGNYLREEVCAKNIALVTAQQRIANDWFAIYNSLDPKIIEDLKGKYKNWADRAK